MALECIEDSNFIKHHLFENFGKYLNWMLFKALYNLELEFGETQLKHTL